MTGAQQGKTRPGQTRPGLWVDKATNRALFARARLALLTNPEAVLMQAEGAESC